MFFPFTISEFEVYGTKNSNEYVENCVIFELIVFLIVHFIEFDDNKVCHANGVSTRNTQELQYIYIYIFFIEAKTILKRNKRNNSNTIRNVIVVRMCALKMIFNEIFTKIMKK